MKTARILVLGAGPAGAAVALLLGKMGYLVTIVSDWRRLDVVEGVSMRVLDGLRHAGLLKASGCIEGPSPRATLWNGAYRTLNAEFLIDRRAFDRALRRDLQRAGIKVIEANVRSASFDSRGHQVQIEGADGTAVIHADFLVEARGRAAPLSGKRLRGPEALSLLNIWQGPPGPVGSAIESLADGWAWMARLSDGRCYWQMTLDVASTDLPAKEELSSFCAVRRQSALATDFFSQHPSVQPRLHARSSTATLYKETGGPNWLRVGDAAMAVDPLSGNGIFQSLSSALQAPAVINTLLSRPERAPLALRFHQRRIEQLFTRFARTGRDFYAMEQRWAKRPFWQARSCWPDAHPIHLPADFCKLTIERAPVIDGDLIDEAEVVISPDQPLGIWHLQGVKLAPIVHALRHQSAAQALEILTPEQRRIVRNWLATQGYQGASA